MAVLTPALTELRATFNRCCPNRDKASDGWIGDTSHAAGPSSHNPDETGRPEQYDADSVDEVHAIDVDEDLRASDVRGQFTMLRAVRQLVEDHRTGREDRLTYVIYERTIWAASWGWTARQYTGSNPHDRHAHLNGSYEAAKERDTSPWNIGFVEDDMPTVGEIWAHQLINPVTGKPVSAGALLRYNDMWANRILEEIAALRVIVEQQGEIIRAGGGSVDTAAILAGVDERLAALPTAEAIADAVADEAATRMEG